MSEQLPIVVVPRARKGTEIDAIPHLYRSGFVEPKSAANHPVSYQRDG